MTALLELLREGDVWRIELAPNPVFSGTKWLPASMWGTLFVRRAGFVCFALGRDPHCKVEFRCADRSGMAASCACLRPWST